VSVRKDWIAHLRRKGILKPAPTREEAIARAKSEGITNPEPGWPYFDGNPGRYDWHYKDRS